MACSISITSVSGLAQVVPSGCRTIVTVAGTVTTPVNVAPCPEVSVTIRCPCGPVVCTVTGKVDANGVLTGGAAVLGGYLVNGQWQLVLQTSCCCDAQIYVGASCPALGCTDSVSTLLNCDKCCPTITTEVSHGPCDANDQSPVTFLVHMDIPPGCPAVIAWMDFGDGSPPSPSHSFSPPSSSFPWSHAYSSGTYLAQIVIGTPNDCPGVGVPVTVSCPKTDCCPQLSTTLGYGECDAQGQSLVTLTTTYYVPAGCPPAQIQTDFGYGPLGPTHTITGLGTIVETRPYPSGSYAGYVLVNLPQGCPASPFKVEVVCPPNCCPTLSTEVGYGRCLNGAAVATFTVNVTIPAGCPPVVLYIDFGDGAQSASHTLASSGSFTESHSYPTGSYLAIVKVAAPAGCPPEEVKVAVQCPPVDCCPQIATKVSYGDCDDAGNAVVTLVTTVTPKPAPCPPAKVQVDFGGGDVSAVHTFATAGSFTETRTFSAGPHVAVVNVLSPAGCQPIQVNIFVPCTNCCPDVSVSPCIPDCSWAPDRTVEFKITVAPKPAPCPPKAVSFQMDFGDGTQGQSVTIPAGGPAYTYTETHTYSGADALQDNSAALIVSQPPECAGSYGSVVIPKCCKQKRTILCWALLWMMSWAFTLAVIALLSWLFGSMFSPPISLQAFFVLASAGVAMLIVFLIFCTKCLCGWVYRLLWRVFFGAGLLYAIHAACTIYHWMTVLIGALLILLAFVFLWLWKQRCCVSKCHCLAEVMFWFGGNILVLAAILLGTLTGAGCQFALITSPWKVTVLDVAAFLFGMLSAYYYGKCPPARAGR